MSKFRENLVDRMIKIYGFENPVVIQFCGLCERMPETPCNDKGLTVLVETYEALPMMNAED